MTDEFKPPKPRRMTFLFAKINFLDLFGKKQKDKFHENLLAMQNKKSEVKRFFWALGDVGKEKCDGLEIVYGRFGKTPTERFKKSYDEQKHSYNGLAEDRASDWANFFCCS